MGLDIVEFVMSVEEKFQLEIPDEVKATFVNPKGIVNYVALQVQEKYTREQVAEEIWRILVYEPRIDRLKFDENSLFIEDMGLD